MGIVCDLRHIGVRKNSMYSRYPAGLLCTDADLGIGLLTQNELCIEHACDLPVAGVLGLSPGFVIGVLADITLAHIF